MADGPEHQVLSKDETQMEARVAVLEQIAASTNEILSEIKADIREIRRDQKNDFRITFGALITLAVGMAGLMAHGFKWF
jgi:2-hydroxy-3-keto-5-methylthiopentenyl-1-phosphate phosphatase